MACNLGPDFLCSSITNLRGAEDTLAALVIGMIIYLLIDLGFNTIKEGPLFKRIMVFSIGFAPFFLWKLMGSFRRIFLEKTSAWYGPLNELGEVMEAVSALGIIIALVYMYVMLKPKTSTA